MDPHDDGLESAEVDFATRRLRELDEFLCQPSQSNASSDSSNLPPCLNLLNQLEEISTESSSQEIGPINKDSRLNTPPLIFEADASQSLDSEPIEDTAVSAHEQHPPPLSQQHEEQQHEEQHQSPPRSPVPSNSKSEQQKESEQAVGTIVKLEHNHTQSPTPSVSNQADHPRLLWSFIDETIRERCMDHNKKSNQSPRPERSCDICGCPKYCRQVKGGTLCQNCSKLCNTKRNIAPCRGADCPIVWQPRLNLCFYCRMRKARNLGFIEDDDETESELVNLEQEDLDEDIQMQLAIQASLVQEEEQWEDYSCLINDNTQEEEAKTPRTIEGMSDEIEHPAGGVYIEVTEEEPLPPIDQGLPDNVSYRFSRWWWNDLEGFKKGGIAAKKPEEEVSPPKPVRVVRTSNDISEPQLDFVTQDIDVEEPEPIEEIFTPILQILANASLARGHEPINPGQPLRAGDAVVAQAKPRLTLRLETRRTIIDRRPMLKKLKTGAAPRNNSESNGVSTTSLIAPGEDCDESDDDEILEIDCT